MLSNENIETRTLLTGDGAAHRQRRFNCPVHGYFDFVVFPNAEARHRKCTQLENPGGVGLEIPKTMKKAA